MDLRTLNQESHRKDHNAWIPRGDLPRCSEVFDITAAPALSTLCHAPSNIVPSDMVSALNLIDRLADMPWTERRVPVQMQLCWRKSRGHHLIKFSIMLYVRSIDLAPAYDPIAWALWCHPAESSGGHQPLKNMLLVRGAFIAIIDPHDSSNVPTQYRSGMHECLIAYDPREPDGYLGVIDPIQEVPSFGVIKDITVLGVILNKHYVGGFAEVSAPNGEVHWGRIKLGTHSFVVETDASLRPKKKWLYAGKGDCFHMYLIGVTPDAKDVPMELLGDAALCSDGTILHSYYFDRDTEGRHPDDWEKWRSGYYFNRFYPPSSSRIPSEVISSFEAEMPAWFLKQA